MRWMAAVVCVVMLLTAQRAEAVIAIKATMRDVWLGSDLVLVGKATAVDKERSSVEVAVVEVLKGQAVGEKVIIQFVNQPALFERVKAGQHVIVLNARGQQRHSVHAGDVWTVAEKHEGAKLPKWNVVSDNADMQKTFPGGTAALVEALRLQKQGKLKMEVKWDDGKVFPAGWTKAGSLSIKGATRIETVDLDGDKSMELIAEMPRESRLFAKDKDTYKDITRAMKFSRANPPGEAVYGAEVDVTGDGQADLVHLFRGGKLEVRKGNAGGEYGQANMTQLWEGDEADSAQLADYGEGGRAAFIVARQGSLFRYHVGESGAAEEDFARMTGEKLASYHPAGGGRMKSVRLVDIDLNGDERMDLVVVAQEGMFAMLNRGHGAFFASSVAVKSLSEGGPKNRASAAWGSGALVQGGPLSLLAADEEGVLYEAAVTKP